MSEWRRSSGVAASAGGPAWTSVKTRPRQRMRSALVWENAKGVVAGGEQRKTGPKKSGRHGTGGIDRPKAGEAPFREGGSGLGGAYRPRLSPATRATRSSVAVFKRTPPKRRLDAWSIRKRWPDVKDIGPPAPSAVDPHGGKSPGRRPSPVPSPVQTLGVAVPPASASS